MRVYERLRKHAVIEQIAPDLAAAVGPAALAELVSVALFLAMMFVWFGVIQ